MIKNFFYSFPFFSSLLFCKWRERLVRCDKKAAWLRNRLYFKSFTGDPDSDDSDGEAVDRDLLAHYRTQLAPCLAVFKRKENNEEGEVSETPKRKKAKRIKLSQVTPAGMERPMWSKLAKRQFILSLSLMRTWNVWNCVWIYWMNHFFLWKLAYWMWVRSIIWGSVFDWSFLSLLKCFVPVFNLNIRVSEFNEIPCTCGSVGSGCLIFIRNICRNSTFGWVVIELNEIPLTRECRIVSWRALFFHFWIFLWNAQ